MRDLEEEVRRLGFKDAEHLLKYLREDYDITEDSTGEK